jgi:hypothetical protein
MSLLHKQMCAFHHRKIFSLYERDSDVSDVPYKDNNRRHYHLGHDGMQLARQHQGIGGTCCLHLQGRRIRRGNR